MTLYTLITGFNLYKPEYGYKDLVFSLKFFMHIMDEVRYLAIDSKKLVISYPQYTMLISYMLQTGRKADETFYLPHSSLDFVLETLRRTGHVFYKEPFNQLPFSEDIKAPEIKIIPEDENKANIQIEPGYEII